MSMWKSVPKLSAVLQQYQRCNKKSLLRTESLKEVFPRNGSQRRVISSTRRVAFSSPIADPENKGQSQSGVNFETLGSWNNRLEQQVNVEHSIRAGRLVPEINLDIVGEATLLGRRKKNEDRVTTSQLNPDVAMFAIYDGHGGETAANFVQNRMQEHVVYWLEEKGEKDLGAVLKLAFKDVNDAFIRFLNDNYDGQERYFMSGTTATVCLLRHGVQLVVGHVGDSQALVCREGRSICLTSPHRPEGLEMERIKAAGGFVTMDSLGNARVNGKLEMSRSLGDVTLKSQGVICDPDIRAMQIKHGTDSFLILTTDGVHYVLNDQEIVDIACRCETPAEAARFATDQALHFGSEDNATALVVPFGAWGKYSTTKALHFSFSRNVVTSRS